MPPSSSVLESIISLLATSLGEEAARNIVLREASACGLTQLATREEAVRLLKQIEKAGSTSGLAARLALSRLERGAPLTVSGVGPSFPSEAPPSAGKPVTLSELGQMLAHSLGDAKAEAIVAATAQQLGFRDPVVTHEQAVQVLDRISQQGGVVGTVARFAKAGFLLRQAK